MVIFFALGTCGKKASSVSSSFSFLCSTSCRIITPVNIFEIDPMRNRLAAESGAFFATVDSAKAHGTGVEDVAILRDDDVPHSFIFLGDSVEELVEFGFVQRLGMARSGKHSVRRPANNAWFSSAKHSSLLPSSLRDWRLQHR